MRYSVATDLRMENGGVPKLSNALRISGFGLALGHSEYTRVT